MLIATAGVLAMATIAGAQTPHGFPNIPRTPGTLINGPIAPQQGRTAIVAWHGKRIVSVPEPPGSQAGADLLIRIVDINDPAAPVITTVPASAGGFNSHGYFHSGPYLYIGHHCIGTGLVACNGSGSNHNWVNSYVIGGAGPFFANSNLRPVDIESALGLGVSTYNRSGAHSPWGAEMYWSYGDVGGNAWLAVRRPASQWTHDWANGGAPTGPAVKSSWDHLGQTGVVGMPFIFGNLLIYASDQTGTGVAVYDISNPAAPVLLDVLKDENPGGYWPEIYGHYIFFPRRDGDGGPGSTAGYMVVDFSDPTNLQVVAERNVPGSNQYVTFQDEFAFMNKYKIDMRTFDVVVTLPTNDTTLDASQFALPLANMVVTGGYGTLGPGLALWAHQAEPDVRPPFVAYHIPRPDQTNYSRECPISVSLPETLKTETIVNGSTLIVRPVGGAAIPTWHSFSQGKVLTITPQSILNANTTYEVVLSGIEDAAGNAMEPYSWRFSTGGSVSGGNQPPVIGAINATPGNAAPNNAIALSWSGTDPENSPLEYRVDFGDGTPRTNWSTATSVNKTYTAEGHYQVTVQARDPQGSVVARSRTVTVVTTPTQTASTSSSQMTLDAVANRLFVVNPDNDTVSAINTSTNTRVWEVAVAADPRGIAQGSDGTLWVVCRDGDAIDVLNSTTGALIQRLSLNYGAQPTAIAPLPNRTAMLVSCEGDGTLRRFLVSGRTQNASLAVGPTPRAIAINHAGTRALVTRFISGEHTGSLYDVAIGAGLTLTRTIPLVRDRSSDGPASSRGIPNYLAGITIHPSGQFAWVVGKKDNTTRGTFMSPSLPLESDITVRAQLMLIDLTTNAESVANRLDIDNSDSPAAVAFSPLGDYAFIALQGNAQVAVVDVLDFMDPAAPGTVRTRWGTGIAPQAIVLNGANGRLYSHDFMGRTVTSFDAQAFITQGSGNVPATTIATVGAERLHAQVLTGKRVFYHASDPRMSAEGYISCATCHIDGAHDGRTWDFTDRGEGFRNTTDLRGRSGMGHGLVHWSANFDEIQDFENDIRNAFGGTGFLSASQFAATSNTLGTPKAGLNADLDALAAYVTSLGSASYPRSPHRNADGTLNASATAGAALFTSHNCGSCHVPTADFTDRTRRDVGTVRASSGNRLGATLNGQIDTPTLVGLHASAPYFHDGSAATLEEVFTITGGRLAQAETGTLGGGAYTDTINWFAMKEWQNATFVDMNAGSGTLTFSDVTSNVAGAGIVEVRYNTSYGPATLGVTVNSTTTTVTINETPNEPMWLPNEWRIVRANVTFNAGTNTVRLQRNGGWGGVKIDSVLFSTPQDRVRAAAHVRNFTPTQLADMVAYLRSLDGTNAAKPTMELRRGATLIANGATDSATPPPSGAWTLTYRISNAGAGPLNLGQFRVDAPGGVGATILAAPAPTIAPGGFSDMQVRFATPTAPFAATVTGWTDGATSNQLSWTVQAIAPTTTSNSFVVR